MGRLKHLQPIEQQAAALAHDEVRRFMLSQQRENFRDRFRVGKIPQQLGHEDCLQVRDPIGSELAGVVLLEDFRIEQSVVAHQLPHNPAYAGETVMDDERDAVRIFAFEQPLDCAGDRPPDEQVARLFLEQAKLRIDARRDGVPAQKDLRKRVDRADSRLRRFAAGSTANNRRPAVRSRRAASRRRTGCGRESHGPRGR